MDVHINMYNNLVFYMYVAFNILSEESPRIPSSSSCREKLTARNSKESTSAGCGSHEELFKSSSSWELEHTSAHMWQHQGGKSKWLCYQSCPRESMECFFPMRLTA